MGQGKLKFVFVGALISTFVMFTTAYGMGSKSNTRGTTKNGFNCSSDNECISGNCADGVKCAPEDGTGVGDRNSAEKSDYCHHDNHCESKNCVCPGNQDSFGFCVGYKSWPEGAGWRQRGFCAYLSELGEQCQKNSDCKSEYCANGKRCAPEDGTGNTGEYCHHNNHCKTSCKCPNDDVSWGFCRNWENYTDAQIIDHVKNKTGFVCN